MMKASRRHDAAVGDDEPQDWHLDEVNIEAQAHSNNHSMPSPEEVIAQAGRIRYTTKRVPKKRMIAMVAALVVIMVAIPAAMIVSKGSKASKAATSGISGESPIDKVDGDPSEKDADGDIDHTDKSKQGEFLNEKDSDNDLNHATSDGDGTVDTQDQPDADDAEQRMTTMEEIVEWMVNEDVSHQSTMETAGSPQYRAAEWLAVNDPANLPLPATGRHDYGDGYKYVVRYVMAVNYFALQGQQWAQDFHFMSYLDVCLWNVSMLLRDYHQCFGRLSDSFHRTLCVF